MLKLKSLLKESYQNATITVKRTNPLLSKLEFFVYKKSVIVTLFFRYLVTPYFLIRCRCKGKYNIDFHENY